MSLVQINSTAEIKSQWNNFSDTYEFYMLEATSGIYNLLIPFLNLPSATRIVEVGCGTGNGVSILRSKLPDAVEIVASDISELMLEKAVQKNFTNVQFNIADNENLPYPDNFFDRYVANLSLHIVASPEKMIQEAFRVLQPGGIAAFSFFGRPQTSNFFTLISRSFAQAGHTSNNRSFFHLNDDSSTIKLMEQAGFKARSFYSCVGLNLKTVEDIIQASKYQQNLKDLKNISETTYETVLTYIKAEAEVLISSNAVPTFDCLIIISEKPLN
jgi:ubiquinone/menaquinone biosynthesis C-methylase UbiE